IRQAELDVRRLTELRRQESSNSLPLASQIELDKAIAALDTARAHGRADDRKLEAAEKDITALDQQISLYTLTAPCAGRLGRLQIVLGQTLAIGAAVAEVIDVENEIDVLCFVATNHARKLQVGQLARLAVTDQLASAEGKIVFIADQAEPDTGTFA